MTEKIPLQKPQSLNKVQLTVSVLRKELEDREQFRETVRLVCLFKFIQACKMAEKVNFPVQSSGRLEWYMIIGL